MAELESATLNPVEAALTSTPPVVITAWIVFAFILFCFFFNVILVIVTIRNRTDTSLPLSYMGAMGISGLLFTVLLSSHMFIYLAFSEDVYYGYLVYVGKELSLLGTLSYFCSLFIMALMSMNRLVVVIKPFNTWFTHKKIFMYSGIITLVSFISLIIPYFGPCYITFVFKAMTHVSQCAPGRHPITTFQNLYLILIPFICMFVNIVFACVSRCRRSESTSNIFHYIRHGRKRDPQPPTISSSLSRIQTRRDIIMMRQAFAISVYLSVYEAGALIIRTWPEFYATWSNDAREGFYYFRLLTVPFLNVFVYYIFTGSSRRIIRRFLRFEWIATQVRNIFKKKPEPPQPQRIFTIVGPKAQHMRNVARMRQ